MTIRCTTTLWFWAFWGFIIDSIIRINMSITIVDMVLPKDAIMSNNNQEFVPECYNLTLDPAKASSVSNYNITNELHSYHRLERFSVEREVFNLLKIDYDRNGFDWNEYQQGLVLGSFYWTFWMTQMLGGLMARKYGSKIVFGLGNLISCTLNSAIPILSYCDISGVLTIRLLQGLISGVCFPSMFVITSQWIPPNERSKFLTCYLGGAIGVAVFYPIFGYIISISSWEWVFHASTLLGIVWYINWHYFVFDSPAQHPRIHPNEKQHIESAIGDTFAKIKNLKTPWKEILTSRPVWINSIFQIGYFWGIQTFMLEAPTYFKIIHGWDIRATGVLAGLPHLLKMIFAYYYSIFADYLLRTEQMSRRNVRVMSGIISNVCFGLFTLAVAYSGCNTTVAIVFSIIAVTCNGAFSASTFANIVDLSPNFSSIVMGIVGTQACLSGFLMPYVVGLLTLDNASIQQWEYVYLIAALFLIGSGIIYAIFTEVSIQSWNTPMAIGNRKIDNSDDECENEFLNLSNIKTNKK